MYNFKIKKNNEYENFADIINADKEAKHFIKYRTYSPTFVDDDKDIYDSFKTCKNKHKDGSSFRLVLIFGLLSLFMLAISIYVYITAEPENLPGLIVLPITCLFFMAGFILFISLHLIEHKFVNSVSDLFIVYDKDRNPCSVEISKNKIKVLYKNNLYLVKNNKVKKTSKNRLIYHALLNMYPISVLNIDKYNIKFENTNYSYTLTPTIKYLQDGNSTLSICCPRPIFNMERIQEGERVYFPKPQYVYFSKYIYTIDSNLKLNDIYYAASENAVKSYFILTHAKLKESGDLAENELKKIANKNSNLKEILKDILY